MQQSGKVQKRAVKMITWPVLLSCKYLRLLWFLKEKRQLLEEIMEVHKMFHGVQKLDSAERFSLIILGAKLAKTVIM